MVKKNAVIKNYQCFNKNTGRRVKCCVPMHTFGHPVKIDELVDVCNEYHIELVEDAAEVSAVTIKVSIRVLLVVLAH